MIPTSAKQPPKENARAGTAPRADRRFPQADSMPRNAPYHAGVEGDSSPPTGAARQISAMVGDLSDLECPPMRPVTGLIDEFRQAWQGISRPSLRFSIGFSIG